VKVIGSVNGIDILIPNDAFFSFFNSPYIGHRNQSSVDIYPLHTEWGGPALAPIDGKVVKLKQIKMGKARLFETDDYDYAIGIQPYNYRNVLVRILHCLPSLDIGDEVKAGDEIGTLIRSRYFNFWTNPHYHVEVIQSEHFERSTKSFPIQRVVDWSSSIALEGNDLITQAEWTIERITSDYLIATSPTTLIGRIGEIFGHVAEVDSLSKGILDAGIPHYPHGGIYGANIKSGSVTVNESVIGMLIPSHESSSFFKQNRAYSIYADDIRTRGISTYLYSEHQMISGKLPLKIVPSVYNGFSKIWNEGDSIRLRLRLLE
jgi:hypothetical protein